MISLLAAACIPILGDIEGFSTVTPTIKGEHNGNETALFRIYAREPESQVWDWVYETPYVRAPIDAENPDDGYVEFGEGIVTQFPVQRMVPVEISYKEVEFVIKAVDIENNESAPSNVITICMPLCQEF